MQVYEPPLGHLDISCHGNHAVQNSRVQLQLHWHTAHAQDAIASSHYKRWKYMQQQKTLLEIIETVGDVFYRQGTSAYHISFVNWHNNIKEGKV
jgi:hypothetical protein